MQERQIPLVRRPSGGGTVWHDEGNVNFCCITPLKAFHKDRALEKIKQQLQDFNVEVQINARHDLVVQSGEQSFKVSGSAYKQTKDRSLHHGTLLIHSDLSELNRVLKSPNTLLETRSIPSVRSKVMNLSEINPALTTSSWIESFGEAKELFETDFDSTHWKNWQWVMGETPFFKWNFQIDGHDISLSSHKGLIHELDWPQMNLKIDKLLSPLSSKTFEELSQGKIKTLNWKNFLGS
jgi:lipoate-protein ligase A